MNREDFAKALVFLAETFRANLTDLAMEGYWLVLKGLSEVELKRAMTRALGECEHMPPPARLLAYVKADRADHSLAVATNRRIRELREWQAKGDPKTLDAIRETVAELADAKDANRPHALPREPLVVTEDEKRETLERAAALLAARRTS